MLIIFCYRVKREKKATNPKGLALYSAYVLSRKAEERRPWLRISELKISACLRACKFYILTVVNFEFGIINWILNFEF